jgi:hypothetical protein
VDNARDRIVAEYDRLLDTVIGVHEQVNMDTDEDRDLHTRAIETFRNAQGALRNLAGLTHD